MTGHKKRIRHNIEEGFHRRGRRGAQRCGGEGSGNRGHKMHRIHEKEISSWFVVFVPYVAIPLFLGGLCVLASCAGTPEMKDRPPKELYEEAVGHMEGTKFWFFPPLPDYERALENFKQVVDDYPYSEYASLSRLMIGDVYFKDKKFAESVVAYEEFVRMHPSHPKVPYAAFRIGRSYEEEVLSHDRDQTATLNAIDQYESVARQYPETEYAAQSREKLDSLESKAARHEMYVARFYMKRGQYRAAIYRLVQAEKKFPDYLDRSETVELLREAQERVRELEARGQLQEGILPPQADAQPDGASDGE